MTSNIDNRNLDIENCDIKQDQLNSEIAIQVNIQIIRVYTRLRQFLLNNLYNEDLRKKIESIEKNLVKKDEEIQTIFKIIKELLVQEPTPAREPIGFKIPKK